MSLANPKTTIWGIVKQLKNDKPSVSMFLMHKTQAKTEEKMFGVSRVDIGDNIPPLLRELAYNILKPLPTMIKDDKVRFRDFFDVDRTGSTIFTVDPEKVPAFSVILNKINQ